MQLLGMTSSLHSDYLVTGDFYNPGPYGCFLAVVFPMSAIWMINFDLRIKRIVGAMIVFSCAVLIPITMSRTAIVASVVGGTIAMSEKIKKIHFIDASLIGCGGHLCICLF